MKFEIQSMSDIITNSSSEVFIIYTKDHNKIASFLKDVCKLLGVDVDDVMEFDSVTDDGYVDYKRGHYRKGDLLIWGTGDNSIPPVVSRIIEELRWTHTPNFPYGEIKNVERVFLG